jgi:carboxyl-terminal processing protease
MFSRLKQNFVLFFLILLIVFSFGFWFGKASIICPVLPPDEVDFSLFWEAWKKVEEKYENKEKLNVDEMIYGAISGMIETLDDPYTVFFKPEEAKKFLEDVKGVFEGVGVEIAIKEKQLQVVAPLEGTPAHKAGLRPGDKIMKVDGKSTVNITADTAVDWIRGSKDTEVVLTIYREEWGEERDVKIVRGTIDIPSLKLEIREDNIAYLKLYHFSEEAVYDFREAAIKILGSPAKKIILDLRNNPGGYLPVAQNIAGWFLERGQVVAIEDFGEDEERRELVAEGNARLLTYPVIVLINQGSASGSEILAGALRDNRGVILLGETSFGKGSVQELTELRGGFSLKITIAKWLTPKGYSIADTGLEPDIMVELTQEDYDQGKDPQLDRAIEIIRTLE